MPKSTAVPYCRFKPLPLLLIGALGLQGCAPMAPMPNAGAGAPRSAAIDPCLDQSAQDVGAALGALAGALIAKKISQAKYAMPVGAIAGALIGQAIGKDVARRRCELFSIAKKHNLEMSTVVLQMPATNPGTGGNGGTGAANPVGMAATLVDKSGAGGQFLPDSDVLTPAARVYFTEIAAAYAPGARKRGLNAQESEELAQGKVLIVGHTDDHEDSRTAADLSERRARAVAAVFRQAGVPEASIYYQGAGETLPVADNNSEQGRAANRRVEMVDVASDSVLASYLQSRVSTSSYFRPVTQGAEPAVAAAPAAAEKRTARAESAVSPARAKPADARRTPAVPKRAEPDRPVLAASAAPAAGARSAAAPAALDIGGARFDARSHQVSVGELLRNDGFSLLPLAIADDAPVRSCVDDRARVSRSVKSLRSGSEFKVGEFQPGAYGTSWVGKVNGHLLSLNNVAVVRAGGLPANNPNVMIFKNFSEKDGVTRKPDFNIVPVVNTYAGSRGTLYRVFFEKGAPLRCIDVVLPNTGPFKAERGYVYQDRQQQTFASEFKPEVPGARGL